MDLTNYYELKYQPHNLRAFPETMANQTNDGEDRMQLPSSSMSRSRSSICSSSHQCSSVSGEGTAVHPTHLHPAVTGEGRATAQHLEELRKERQDLHFIYVSSTQSGSLFCMLLPKMINACSLHSPSLHICMITASRAAFLLLCSQC